MSNRPDILIGYIPEEEPGQSTPQPVPGTAVENNRASILSEAERLVNGDRNIDYGDPIDDFRRTGKMWSAYLGVDVEPHDVAALMGMLKLSRIRWSPEKRDHWADLAGYAACGYDCSVRENL